MRAVGLFVIVPLMPVFLAALARASQRTAHHDVTSGRPVDQHVPV